MWPLQKNETSRDPLSHLCTLAHKYACVHTHTHAHILIHITHTRQPLYSVRPLYLPVQILGVTHGTPVGQCIRTVNPQAIANSRWPKLHRSSCRSEIPRPDHSSTIDYFDRSLVDLNLFNRPSHLMIGSHTNRCDEKLSLTGTPTVFSSVGNPSTGSQLYDR